MASNLSQSTSRIELLSKDNYDTWSMQVEALLIKNDVWDYVNGINVKPEQNAETWLKMDRKAKADLVLSIQPSELKQIRGCETSRDVWLKLESIYASKGPARKATLLKQLMLQRLDEGGDVKEHIAKFFDAVDKLESMNVQIHGDLLSIMLLYSLPSSFENFRCAIETRDELPEAEALKVKIIEESEARKQASGPVVAMAASFRGNFNGQQRTYIKCFKCGEPNHKANVCPNKKKKNDKEKQTSTTSKAAESSFAVCTVASNEDVFFANGAINNRSWILDSGCSIHLCRDKDSFEDMQKSTKMSLNLANQTSAEVCGEGLVHFVAKSDGSERKINLKNTLFVPDLRSNLMSVSQITDHDHSVTFSKEGAHIVDANGNTVLVAPRRGSLYYVNESLNCALAESSCSDLFRWHVRLGHLNAADLVKMVNCGVLPNIKADDREQVARCTTCMKGKMTALPFKSSHNLSLEPLQIVHSDVVGPFREEGTGRAKYFVTFIDDCTRWCEVYCMRLKSGVYEAFKAYQQMFEKQTGLKIKCLQTDNGREYVNNDFDKYLADEGIQRRLTIPRTPEQNGVAERQNRTLLDMARCLLLQAGLSTSFWAEAVATAKFIRNRCPTRSLNGQSPYEKLLKVKPDLSNLKIFGSKVVVLDKDPNKNKLSPRGIDGIFVGYPREQKGYRIWIPSSRQVICARDVRFLEDCTVDEQPQVEVDGFFEESKEQPKYIEFSNFEAKDPEPEIQQVQTPDKQIKLTLRAPGRPKLVRTGSRGRPKKLFNTREMSSESSNEVPTTDGVNSDELEDEVFAGVVEVNFKDAINGSECEEWKGAIENEVLSLLKMRTWDIVRTSDSKGIIGCRFVLSNKYNANGDIDRRKARLVAKGYSQVIGVNYHETFAPVARLDTLRLLLTLAVQLGLIIWQFDVVTAYLNGILNEEVYMKVPEMLCEILEQITAKYEEISDVGIQARKMLQDLRSGGNVCRLNKALYGLKQAGRQWYAELHDKLVCMGLKPLTNEPCLFRGYFEGKLVLLLVYVDDLLVAAQDMATIMAIKNQLSIQFEIKDLGRASYCLGLEINQQNDTIVLKQSNYIRDLLNQYGMQNCNAVKTPAELSGCVSEEQEKNCDNCPYRELIGSLMYLSVATRPDISNTVSRLAQFVNNPTWNHWCAGKRILRYLAGTAEMGLKYEKADKPVTGYCDADWGGCTVDRRSYTGYAFLYCGAAISWKSQKQRSVAQSSTEAEYMSLAEAAKEALYLRNLLTELNMEHLAEITISVDNQGALYLAKNPVFHSRTKHIDIKYHFVRQSVCEGLLKLTHVPTQQMVADIMTKALPRSSHERCLKGLGLST